MFNRYTLFAACLLGAAWAQQYTTPVPILKQINRHNDDGSYSYGYEAADGSFKIETKYPEGEVYGKYGYVDDTGKVREVEYGASRRGFEPAGNDINVAPPTLSQNPQAVIAPLAEGQEDDGQYREDPSVYYKDEKYSRPAQQNRQVYRPQEYQQQQYQQPQQQYQQPQQQYQQPQQYQQQYQPQPQYQPQYRPQPQYQQPSYQQSYYQPPQTYQQPYNPQPYLNSAQLVTHPAIKNIDYYSGSYSVDYKKK